MSAKKFENRVPPPVVTSVVALLMWGLFLWFPQAVAAKSSTTLAAVFCVVGLAFIVAGVGAFKQRKTTVNPLDLGKSTAMVNHGIYRVTRNPMYVGMLFLLFAWALFLAHILAMLCLVPWLVYMSRFQIDPEERAMNELFGDEYRVYCQQVRRWL